MQMIDVAKNANEVMTATAAMLAVPGCERIVFYRCHVNAAGIDHREERDAVVGLVG